MQLPPELRRAVEQELASCNPARLRAAAAQLSQCYRQAAESENTAPAINALTDDSQRAAYLAVRLPATFAAVTAALTWTRDLCSAEPCESKPCDPTIRSVLDLGSGPGTALWAAAHVFASLESATAIERDSQLIAIALRLAASANAGGPYSPSFGECGEQAADSSSGISSFPNTCWLQADLTAALPSGTWDLVLCSYALNELKYSQRDNLLRRAWERTNKLLVIIEPGTKAGFANVLVARTNLLACGAHVVAPCPNALACPMSGGDDWCHFAARVERSAEHRRLKDATLGHEDEKFSYVAFSRTPQADQQESTRTRIVRHPRIFSGYTQLTLCRAGEIANTTVTRSMKEDWRRLKRLGWGDCW
jgi:ribosomal protein RSM22 (predicted rRNA methylase)